MPSVCSVSQWPWWQHAFDNGHVIGARKASRKRCTDHTSAWQDESVRYPQPLEQTKCLVSVLAVAPGPMLSVMYVYMTEGVRVSVCVCMSICLCACVMYVHKRTFARALACIFAYNYVRYKLYT